MNQNLNNGMSEDMKIAYGMTDKENVSRETSVKKSKWSSRKFLLSVAAFLGSIGTSLAALQTDNQKVAIVSIVCAVLSSAIYAGCEAYIDANKIDS